MITHQRIGLFLLALAGFGAPAAAQVSAQTTVSNFSYVVTDLDLLDGQTATLEQRPFTSDHAPPMSGKVFRRRTSNPPGSSGAMPQRHWARCRARTATVPVRPSFV